MKQKFKITCKQQLRMVFQALIVPPLILTISYFYSGSFDLVELVIFTSVIFILDTLPVIILHYQYLRKNFGLRLTIDNSEKVIIFEKEGNAEVFSISDVSRFQCYSSYGGGSGFYSMAEYRYCSIRLKNGKEYIITCLMVPNLKSTLEKSLKMCSEKQMRFVCFLPPLGRYSD